MRPSARAENMFWNEIMNLRKNTVMDVFDLFNIRIACCLLGWENEACTVLEKKFKRNLIHIACTIFHHIMVLIFALGFKWILSWTTH